MALYAGDALLETTTRRSSGVPVEKADALIANTARAEQSISSNLVKQLTLFKGVIQVDKEQHHNAHRGL